MTAKEKKAYQRKLMKNRISSRKWRRTHVAHRKAYYRVWTGGKKSQEQKWLEEVERDYQASLARTAHGS